MDSLFSGKDHQLTTTYQGIFASGNERTPVRTNGKYKYGIEFGAFDSLGMLYDLMNESKEAATYYIEMVISTVVKGIDILLTN
jgi:hypothetical protein